MNKNYVIIYGGSSLISKELLKILSKDYSNFIIFCRDKGVVQKYIHELKLEKSDIKIYEADVLDLELNFSIIKSFENNILGLIWVSGITGDPEEEYLDTKKCEENIRVNFLNPVLIINKILPKIIHSYEN